MGHELRSPCQLGRDPRSRFGADLGAEHRRHPAQHLLGGGLVECHPNVVVVDVPEVETGEECLVEEGTSASGGLHRHGVEERTVDHLMTGRGQGRDQCAGEPMHLGRHGREALGPMPAAVEPGNHGKQHLGGADIGGRLLPSDVLLTGLQCQPVGDIAQGVPGDADQAAGQRPDMSLRGRDERGVRTSVAEGDTEPLGRSHHDVRPPLPGRGEQGQGEEICRHGHHGPRPLHLADEGPMVSHRPRRSRVLEQHPEPEVGIEAVGEHPDLDTRRPCPGLDHLDCRQMTIVVDVEDRAVAFGQTTAHRHRLRGCGRLVEERCVGHLETGEVRDHGLEVE